MQEKWSKVNVAQLICTSYSISLNFSPSLFQVNWIDSLNELKNDAKQINNRNTAQLQTNKHTYICMDN